MSTGEIIFYMKGADTVMNSRVQYNDWLEEEVPKLSIALSTSNVSHFVPHLYEPIVFTDPLADTIVQYPVPPSHVEITDIMCMVLLGCTNSLSGCNLDDDNT